MFALRNATKVFSKNSRRFMGYISNRSSYWLERIGNREMVSFGMNGMPMYFDTPHFPCPAIRFKESTPEVLAILEKQKGDWRLLTKEEKKAIYRANFGQTFSEFKAPTGEWMEVAGWVLILCSAGIWLFIFLKVTVDDPLPKTFKPCRKRAQLRRQIDLKINPIEGLASKWDYEKNEWKVKGRPNPFIWCELDLDDEDD